MNISKKRMLFLAICIVIAFAVSKYFCRIMLIQGNSMEPSFHNLQMVVLDVRERDFHAGDVVAFRCEGLSAVLVKRVAAVPGDSVKISDGKLIINGDESFLFADKYIDYSGLAQEEIILAEHEYFMLGDNLSESIDSRYPEVGRISDTQMIGKVILF